MKIDPLNREYPVLQSHTVEIPTKAGQIRYNIPDADMLRSMIILGVMVRKQAAGNTRKSKNGNVLISNAALDVCFVTLEVDSKRVINDHPLSHFIHENGVNGPGDYAQLHMDRGFDPTTSYIRFSDAAVVENDKAVELTFIYALSEEVCNV